MAKPHDHNVNLILDFRQALEDNPLNDFLSKITLHASSLGRSLSSSGVKIQEGWLSNQHLSIRVESLGNKPRDVHITFDNKKPNHVTIADSQGIMETFHLLKREPEAVEFAKIKIVEAIDKDLRESLFEIVRVFPPTSDPGTIKNNEIQRLSQEHARKIA